MRKQSTLASRLKEYSALGAVIIAAPEARAQILYTDLNPDVVIDVTNPHYDFDVNSDGYTDFYFYVNTFDESEFRMYMINAFLYNGSRLLVNPGPDGGQVRQLEYGYLINGQAEKWDNYGVFAYHSNGDKSYPWKGVESYVGLKFANVESTAFRGWIRVEVHVNNPSDLSIIVKDYAYNADAAQEILAGEGAVPACNDSHEPNNSFSAASSVNENEPLSAMINPSGDKDFYQFHVSASEPNIRVMLSGLPKNYDVKLFDE